MAKKTVKTEKPLIAETKKPGKKSIKKKRMANFNFAEHNKKIAKKRGESWKKHLLEAKMREVEAVSKIREIRIKKGLSQRSLLKLTSLKSLTSLGKIERGERTANHKNAMEIAKALGVSSRLIFSQVEKTGKARYATVMVI